MLVETELTEKEGDVERKDKIEMQVDSKQWVISAVAFKCQAKKNEDISNEAKTFGS